MGGALRTDERDRVLTFVFDLLLDTPEAEGVPAELRAALFESADVYLDEALDGDGVRAVLRLRSGVASREELKRLNAELGASFGVRFTDDSVLLDLETAEGYAVDGV